MNTTRTRASNVPPPRWIVGWVDTAAGPIPSIATTWSRRDRVEHLRCRIGSLRNNYAVAPGLYATGRPGPHSAVLITANYKLSFDHLRRALHGIDAWVLVLDTRGVNVWCAAGKGTFGTGELVRVIRAVDLEDVVQHRHIIVPQLGAPGVAAHEVQRATRFRVHFGPVRASDIPAYLDAELEATPEMRRVRFRLSDRLALVPMELIPAAKAWVVFAALVLFTASLRRQGFDLQSVRSLGMPLAGLGCLAVLAGAVVTPVLLPVVPGRAFAVKGAIVGLMLTAAYAAFVPAVHANGVFVGAFAWLFVPAASSYLALQLTGSSTFTGMSGVRKELRYFLPVHLTVLTVAVALLVARTVTAWRGS